ncbi:hypothetical protein PS720_01505 [Pseudomonas fluorescens]|nr:hypothetical protein SAMN05428951_102243 [Pseudomonas sp. OV546]VVN86413.1 hypothetical protein PS720_01505 [Pseudomonas fluorescens]
MTVSNTLAPTQTAFVAPASAPAPTAQVSINPAQYEGGAASSLPRMQGMGLTNLRQTLMQGVSNHVSARMPTALNIKPEDKEKTKGAVITLGGSMAQGIGKRLVNSGGVTGKLLGGALVWGGRAAEEIGKDRYSSAGSSSNSSGTYNAYSPSAWGAPSTSK